MEKEWTGTGSAIASFVLSVVGGLIAVLWIGGISEIESGKGLEADNAIVGAALVVGVLLFAQCILWLCAAVFFAHGFGKASVVWRWLSGAALAGSGLPLLWALVLPKG